MVILGPMGVGKSTTAEALAEALGYGLADSDDDIDKLLGCSGAEVAATHGVDELHRLEQAVLLGALLRDTPMVIAGAASVVEGVVVRQALARLAVVVRLILDGAEVLRRQRSGTHRRPMSAGEYAVLAERREPYFVEVEDLRLDADQPTVQLVAAIVDHLRARRDTSGWPP